MKDSAIIWCLVASFVAGGLVGFVAVATMHRHYHEVIKISCFSTVLHNAFNRCQFFVVHQKLHLPHQKNEFCLLH